MSSEKQAEIGQERRAAIVLCGGRGTRMGVAKATLPFGPEVMLQRVVRLVSQVLPTVVVVSAAEQTLPPLPPGVLTIEDRQPGRGPLEGLAAGLAALPETVEAAFVTSCDVPLLAPGLIDRLFELLGDAEIAVPREEKFYHPLTAVYRRRVVSRVEKLLAADRMRPAFLFEEVKTREVPIDALRAVDPELHSLLNLNHPADYLAALALAGLEPEAEVLKALGV